MLNSQLSAIYYDRSEILNDCYIEKEFNVYFKPFEEDLKMLYLILVVSWELFLIFLGLLNDCLVYCFNNPILITLNIPLQYCV